MCGVFFRYCSDNDCSLDHDDLDLFDFHSIIHRGPDSSSILRFHESTFIGFHRLAIRSIADGKQPYEFEGFIGVFNGELYNEQEIRVAILSRYPQHQDSLPNGDMQILAMYLILFGNEAIENVRGMFAGLLFNTTLNQISLFRDRFGEKPLFYILDSNHLFVSSEASFSMEKPYFHLSISTLVKGYYEPSNEGLQEVSPGEIVTVDFNCWSIIKFSYWKYENTKSSSTLNLESFSKVFESSVLEKLTSDVPLSLMFSGGLDSTSILVATSLLERNVQPFTLALPGRGYDESQQAINICKELGLDLQVVAPNIDDILLVLPHIFDSMDVPIFDTAVVSNYLLCREISNHFKVTLSGDGGDEIFRGYSLYDLLPWLNFINRFFNYENTLWLTRLLKFLHRTEKYTNSLFKLERLNAGLKLGDFNPDLSLSPLAGTQLLDLIQSDLSVPLKNLTEYQELCYVRQVDNLYRKKIQPLVYLRKTDRMSMSNGLEVRNPFLDHRLLEFESGQGKLAVGTKKIILRDYCRKLIPDVLLPSKKHGFGFPVSLILSKIAEPDWILPLSTRQMKAVHETWIDATERRHANSAIAAWALLVLNEFAKKSARYITWL